MARLKEEQLVQFGHVHCEMSIRHSKEDTEQTDGFMNLGLKGDFKVKNVNQGVNNMAYTMMGLDAIAQGMREHRGEI